MRSIATHSITINPERTLEVSAFTVNADQQTPFIKFDSTEGVLLIKGNSTREDAWEFYQPLLHTIRKHFLTQGHLSCYLFLKEFNLQTVRVLFSLFGQIATQQAKGKKVTIHWFSIWHQQEMIDTGMDFSDLYDLDLKVMLI